MVGPDPIRTHPSLRAIKRSLCRRRLIGFTIAARHHSLKTASRQRLFPITSRFNSDLEQEQTSSFEETLEIRQETDTGFMRVSHFQNGYQIELTDPETLLPTHIFVRDRAAAAALLENRGRSATPKDGVPPHM